MLVSCSVTRWCLSYLQPPVTAMADYICVTPKWKPLGEQNPQVILTRHTYKHEDWRRAGKEAGSGKEMAHNSERV